MADRKRMQNALKNGQGKFISESKYLGQVFFHHFTNSTCKKIPNMRFLILRRISLHNRFMHKATFYTYIRLVYTRGIDATLMSILPPLNRLAWIWTVQTNFQVSFSSTTGHYHSLNTEPFQFLQTLHLQLWVSGYSTLWPSRYNVLSLKQIIAGLTLKLGGEI